jgi:hypothetical protein
MEKDLDAWIAAAPTVHCGWQPLETYRRSLVDPGRASLLAAGAAGRSRGGRPPWFMTMFGRDSILTSCSPLPLHAPSWRRRRCARWPPARTRIDDFRARTRAHPARDPLRRLTAFEAAAFALLRRADASRSSSC